MNLKIMRALQRNILITIIFLGIFTFIYFFLFHPVMPRIGRHIRSKPSSFFLKKCNCTKHKNFRRIIPRNDAEDDDFKSTCSEEADWLGLGQRVISFGLHDNPNITLIRDSFPVFLLGIYPNVQMAKLFYPGWFIRLYSNVDLNRHLCLYACLDEVVWCDVREQRNGLTNLDKVNPRLWRFMPLGDPLVDIFVSRDLDSLISEREYEVVDEWLNSSKIFHAFRDGWEFFRPISAGAFGAKNFALPGNISKNLRTKFINVGLSNSNNVNLDEDLLEKLIFVPYWKQILVHDSYFCTTYPNVTSHPFPKQRKSRESQATLEIMRYGHYQVAPCPAKCRPSYGKNWTYC